jgi:hypothetical protein
MSEPAQTADAPDEAPASGGPEVSEAVPAERTQEQSDARRAARRSVRSARRQLARVQRKAQARRSDVDLLKAQIEILRAELRTPVERQASFAGSPEEQETDRGVASYVMSARMHRRHNTTGVHRPNRLREPILELYSKTAARAFAEQHGVQIPASLGSWATPDLIDWASLPDRFVMKSNRGGGGVSVFPLERRGQGFFDYIANEMTTAEAVAEKLWKKHHPESVYFAEEFLVGREGSGLPDDIKVFCFYGEPAYIEVRSEDWSRSNAMERKARAFLPDGTELFNTRALIERSESISRPHDFATIAEVSGRLSRAIRRPLERIDFYETDHGIVFGELTQNPGRPPALVPHWDRRMGDVYEDAAARLFSDLVSEGLLGLQYGELADEQNA